MDGWPHTGDHLLQADIPAVWLLWMRDKSCTLHHTGGFIVMYGAEIITPLSQCHIKLDIHVYVKAICCPLVQRFMTIMYDT